LRALRLPQRPRIDVFAVEDRSAQVCWPGLPGQEMTLEVGDQELLVGAPAPGWYRQAGLAGWLSRRSGAADQVDGDRDQARFGARREEEGTPGRLVTTPAVPATGAGPGGPAGPGAATIGGLHPGTSYDVLLSGSGWPRQRVATLTTLGPPPGRLLSRFATIGDCHIGEPSVGALRRYRDPDPRPPDLPPYAERCARVAIAEAEAWGAELLVAKGDLTYEGEVEEFEDAARVLGGASVPVEAILGNHDVRVSPAAAEILTASSLLPTLRPRARDLPGVRLVLGHSPVAHRHSGAITPTDVRDLARLASEAAGPVVVALHHPPSRWPVQTHYPPSIVWRDTTHLVDDLAAANPATVIIAGHTHRNRRYPVRGLTVSEVASTKDYPGVWAGYSIYEGGIRQVVYRVAEPTAIAWTELTRRVLGGIWGWWSPGRLSDRCWTLEWPQVR
jgi:3',5'-cyclic-AMP phosphodiesterase